MRTDFGTRMVMGFLTQTLRRSGMIYIKKTRSVIEFLEKQEIT